jgi:hypothetical protein
MTPETAGDRTGPSRRPVSRRRRLAAAAAGLLALFVVSAVVLTRGDDERATPAATGTSSSAPSPGPTPGSPAAGPTPLASANASVAPAPGSPTAAPAPGSADELPPALPQVELTDTASVGDGVSVEVATIERFEGEAVGPGNVSGPAVRVTVRITNDTAEPLDVDSVSVNVGLGPDVTPAPPLDDVSRAPFSGTVAPGGTAEGRYVFRLPPGAQDPAVVEVGYRPGAPLALFVGPLT